MNPFVKAELKLILGNFTNRVSNNNWQIMNVIKSFATQLISTPKKEPEIIWGICRMFQGVNS
jgi:hypothetical protein